MSNVHFMQTLLIKMILEVGDYDYLPQSWFLNYHGKCNPVDAER